MFSYFSTTLKPTPLISVLIKMLGSTRWCSLFTHCATSPKFEGSIPSGVTGIFSLTYSFQPQYDPGVDSASNINEYPEYFLGVKAAGVYG